MMGMKKGEREERRIKERNEREKEKKYLKNEDGEMKGK